MPQGRAIHHRRTPTLHSVVAEDIVLVAAGAVRALQAADEKQSHAHRDHDGEGIFDGREPLNEILHTQSPYSQ
jgi:hypothetical protein